MENPLLITILLTGIFVTVVNYLAKRKLKKLNISDNRKNLYKKSIRTPFGSLLFLFLKVNL